MPEGHIKFFPMDLQKRVIEFKPGVVLNLQPFPDTLAVGIDPDDPSPRKGGVKDDPMAPVSTLRPWKNASNMDINELQEGSTLFVPVFLKGGLIWTGDSHCRQGNGEVSLTALECSNKEIRLQPIVRKDMKLNWPFIETRTHWITTGFNEDLNVAMTNAVREAVDWLANQKMVPMDRYEAYGLVSGGRLPSFAGGGCPQGCTLHDFKVHLHKPQEVLNRSAHVRAFVLAFAALLVATPGTLAQEKIRIVTTSADLKYLVDAVGGDRVEAESLTAPEQDPHYAEVKPSQLARLHNAELIVRIGLDHEPWLTRLRVPEVPVVDWCGRPELNRHGVSPKYFVLTSACATLAGRARSTARFVVWTIPSP